MAIGGLIFWHAALSLSEPRPAPDPRTLLVLVPVIAAKEWMFHRLRARGKAIGSTAIVTEAWHQRSDVVTSIAALTGILIAWAGGPHWSHADSWAAMVASVWLVGVGLWLLNPTLHELMEGSVDPALTAFVRQTGLDCPGIRGHRQGVGAQAGHAAHRRFAYRGRPGHLGAGRPPPGARGEVEDPDPNCRQVLDVMVHVEPYEPDRLHPAATP